MRNLCTSKGKRLFLFMGLALLLSLLAACGTNSNTATGSNGPEGTATTPPTQHCGTIHTMQKQVIPADQKSAKETESCFWQAYQQCHPATLVYSQASVDTIALHTFSLKSQHGQCVITDTLQHRTFPHPPKSVENYTCAKLAQQADGLHFLACSTEGNILVPEGKA